MSPSQSYLEFLTSCFIVRREILDKDSTLQEMEERVQTLTERLFVAEQDGRQVGDTPGQNGRDVEVFLPLPILYNILKTFKDMYL